MEQMMSYLMADKRRFFAAFGAIGGLLSGIVTLTLGFGDNVFQSWVLATAADGVFIASFLVYSQSRYLGKAYEIAEIQRAALIGGIGGAAAGLSVVWFFQPMINLIFGGDNISRAVGWTVCGGVVGYAVHKVIPNLSTSAAIKAGAIGGFAGFICMSMLFYAMGVAVTGAIIGLALALIEMKTRKRWLEVTLSPVGFTLQKERTLSVTLGNNPIILGCTPKADVQIAEISGTGHEFAKVQLEGERVIFNDLIKNTRSEIKIGDTLSISNAKIELRSC